MSIAQLAPSSADLPADGVPSEETASHAAPFDPEMIARMANAFFRAPPGAAAEPPLPFGLPVAAPNLTDAPAPSIVTTLAPVAPARAPYGPPDIPQTTIPSVVPTPNVPAPAAPTNMHSPTRPLGIADVPQPGASLGGATPVGAPGDIDYSAIPRLLAGDMALVPPTHLGAFGAGAPGGAVPGGLAPAHSSELYFLDERALGASTPSPSVPATPSPPFAEPHLVPPTAFAETASRPPSANPEAISLSAPLEAEPHRISDTVSLATPTAPAPFPSGFENSLGPGAAGPIATDALYFVSHSGGHQGIVDAASAPTKDAPQGYEPRLLADAAATREPFDPYSVRRDFPILQQQVHGKPLIWLDNAATTQKPQAVIDRLSHFYEYENSNIHRAAHALAARATDAYETAREKVRRFLKAPNVKDIIFVRGTTEGINLVAQAWGRRNVKEGDEIVISWLEHHANIVPWQMLSSETGARLRVAPVDDRGQIILDEYEKLLGPKTRIVAISHVSNALGTVTPVREMTAMAHRHGARVLVDGAQSVSHMPVDVQSIDCDFFVFSGHKVFGPTGIGVVYGKDEVLQHMPPWQGGGNMIADVTFERTIYQGPPERFEAGTGNIADAVGLGAALDYVESIGMEVIGRYEHDLLVYATEKMQSVPGLTLIGTAAEKASVLSFVLRGHDALDVGKALDREGIAVRAGHHCAQPILRRFGLEATVRPALAFYNTCADVDALVAALLRLQSGVARAF